MVAAKVASLNASLELLLISTQSAQEDVCLTLFQADRARFYSEYSTGRWTVDRGQPRLLSMELVPAIVLHGRPAADLRVRGRRADALVAGPQWNHSLPVRFSYYAQVRLTTDRLVYLAGDTVRLEVRVHNELGQPVQTPLDLHLHSPQAYPLRRWTQIRSADGRSIHQELPPSAGDGDL